MEKTPQELLQRYFVILLYMLLINILLTLSTVSLHELGHFLMGISHCCENIKIILFDVNNLSTYTEMNCEKCISVEMIAAGFLFVLTPVSLLFFLLKERPERLYGLMMIGLNLIIGVSDVKKIIDLPLLLTVETLVGMGLVIWAELLMINNILGKEFAVSKN